MAALAFGMSILDLGAQTLVVTEFLTSNTNGLLDADGDDSDWAEFHNPTDAPISLDGWGVTNDPADAFQWVFPAIDLAPGGFLVVFASGKDRADPEEELHLNFRLSPDGEYFALVRPDGVIEQEFNPYPIQRRNVSYGIGQLVETTPFIVEGGSARVFVPQNGTVDATWTTREFNDAGWTLAELPAGYDTEDGGPIIDEVNLARDGVATQSSTAFGGDAARAIDGNTSGSYGSNSITHTGNNAGSWWQVDLGEEHPLGRIVLWNRLDCCSQRLSRFRVTVTDGLGEVSFTEDYFEDGGFPANQDFEIELPIGTRGEIVRVTKFAADSSGSHYLSLSEVQVFGGPAGLGSLLATDLEAEMNGVGSSLYLRIPFDFAGGTEVEFLNLNMRYNDGFVAYLNNEEIARANAPGAVAWNSEATAERSTAESTAFETFSASSAALRVGENVLAVHLLNVASDDTNAFVDIALEGVTIEDAGNVYFTTPTPGGANPEDGLAGLVADTTFSVDRGFYENPIEVEISTLTPGAVIRYTTDESEPTATHGEVYSGPIQIDTTTVLRAAAFRSGFAPTNIDTHTYIYLDDVIASSVMDPAITGHAVYGPQMRNALTDLPTISLVSEDAFNDGTEVSTSIEFIRPEDGSGFQENLGVKRFGGAFTNFAKKNFRMYFRSEYGVPKLKYRLFEGHDRGIRAVERFDQLELRSGSHDMNQRGFYMSNRFTDDTMLDMGNVNPHGQFVHLYINGTYWGQYHLRERWNADMLAQYLGGEKEDYEAINGNWNVGGWAEPGSPYDGDGSAWSRIKSLRNNYEAVRRYLDVGHYVDFMLMFMFGNSEDEYRCVGPTSPGSGFKFFLNDADGFTRSAGNRTVRQQPGREDGDGPGSIFSMLLAEGHPDYKTLLGDHVHRHFFNDGPMTRAKNIARLEERCDQVRRAFYAEAARWGYRSPTSWESAKNSYINTVLSTRTETVISQYRSAGFYPRLEAPEFAQHGGRIPESYQLTITAEDGTVYYTLDGRDPRLPGGTVLPDALEAGSLEKIKLVSEGASARWLVPSDGSLGLDWTASDGFDDGSWNVGATGFGYERSSGYEDHIATDVEAAMYDVNPSIYLRIPFDLDGAPAGTLKLLAKYDDGFVAYLNGVEILRINVDEETAWNSSALSSHSDSLAVIFEEFDIPEHVGLLRNGENVLAFQAMNRTTTNGDFLFSPELLVARPLEGQEIILDRTTHVKSRAFDGVNWSALNEATFVRPSLRITEVMYHPEDPGPGVDDDDVEFVEFQNVMDHAISLDGIQLRGGIEFDFGEGDVPGLDPGEVVIVVGDRDGFEEVYDTTGMLIAGEFRGNLHNAADQVTLIEHGDTTIDFVYDDRWYPETDGGGFSLVIVDPLGELENWGLTADSWRVSSDRGGSPGVDETGGFTGGRQFVGDSNQDGSVNIADAVSLLQRLFGGGAIDALPCDGETMTDGGNLRVFDINSDSGVNLADAVYLLNYLFADGSPPAAGTQCQRIEGCGSACVR